MYHTLDYIQSKPSDFKVCNDCGCINWYENEECHFCNEINWNTSGSGISYAIQQEIKYYCEINDLEYPDDNLLINTEITT